MLRNFLGPGVWFQRRKDAQSEELENGEKEKEADEEGNQVLSESFKKQKAKILNS